MLLLERWQPVSMAISTSFLLKRYFLLPLGWSLQFFLQHGFGEAVQNKDLCVRFTSNESHPCHPHKILHLWGHHQEEMPSLQKAFLLMIPEHKQDSKQAQLLLQFQPCLPQAPGAPVLLINVTTCTYPHSMFWSAPRLCVLATNSSGGLLLFTLQKWHLFSEKLKLHMVALSIQWPLSSFPWLSLTFPFLLCPASQYFGNPFKTWE